VIDGGAISQLSVVVLAPTFDVVRFEKRARVQGSRGDLGDYRVDACHVDRSVALGSSSVAQLTAVVVSPTLQSTRIKCGAREGEPGSERPDATAQPDYRLGCRVHISRSPVANRAERVVAPAFHASAIREDAGVVGPGDNFGNSMR